MLKPADLSELIVNVGSLAAWTLFAASTIRCLLLVVTGGPARYVFSRRQRTCLSTGTKDILHDRSTTQNGVVLVTFFTLAVSVVVGVGPGEGMSEYLPYDLDA